MCPWACGYCVSYPLRCVYGWQGLKVRQGELNAFPLKFLIDLDHACKIWAAPECIGPCLEKKEKEKKVEMKKKNTLKNKGGTDTVRKNKVRILKEVCCPMIWVYLAWKHSVCKPQSSWQLFFSTLWAVERLRAILGSYTSSSTRSGGLYPEVYSKKSVWYKITTVFLFWLWE